MDQTNEVLDIVTVKVTKASSKTYFWLDHIAGFTPKFKNPIPSTFRKPVAVENIIEVQ